MNEDRWSLVKRLYWEVQELPASEREAFLQRSCGHDPEALAELRGMLASEVSRETTFLRSPVARSTLDLELPALPRRLDDFELVEELGRGGMGVVYRARQLSLGREVAVKVLPADFSLDERQVERFQREAQAVAQLSHPGIVPVFTVGRHGHEHYFSMELVNGHDLHHELKRLVGDEQGEHFLPDPGSREYLSHTVQMVRKIALSLDHAHRRGVVHRDVKPRNLILEPPAAGAAPTALLLDFGLARDDRHGRHTRSATLAGTPHYMSPEQVRAKRAAVDARTDLYSLGVVLYELLTLRCPFTGSTSLEVMQHITQQVPPSPRKLNPRVPRDLETVCLKAMEKEAADRYPDMAAFAEDLGRFLNHEAVRARRPSARVLAARHLGRHRRSYLAAACGALLFLGGLAVWSALAHTARVEDLRRELSALRSPDLSARPVEEVVALQTAARALLAAVEPDSDAGREASTALTAVSAHVDDCTSRGRALLAAELDPPGGRDQTPVSQGTFNQAMLLLGRASRLCPDDTELRDAAARSTYDPRVRVVLPDELADAAAEGRVRVTYRPIEWWSLGPELPLEGWRDGEVRLPAGGYRLRVDVAGGGFAECTRYLSGRNMVYEVAPAFRDHAELVADMIHVPAGPAIVGRTAEKARSWLRQRSLFVDEFWIDRAELSNAEYLAFVEATGAEPPFFWYVDPDDPRPTMPEGWDDLPVAGVPWFAAVACAEWYGKRLPTWYEWEKAARGTEGWLLPWAPKPAAGEDLSRRASVGTVQRPGDTDAEHYRAGVRPVGSNPLDLSPFGLLDTFGNVSEWTESVYPQAYDGRVVPLETQRVWVGRDWGSMPVSGALLDSLGAASVDSYRIGLRFVRGAPRPAER